VWYADNAGSCVHVNAGTYHMYSVMNSRTGKLQFPVGPSYWFILVPGECILQAFDHLITYDVLHMWFVAPEFPFLSLFCPTAELICAWVHPHWTLIKHNVEHGNRFKFQ
jgi:hypothetical protein